ncbi:MAG: glycosyltransferase [Longimicrobiaceae bacterium]
MKLDPLTLLAGATLAVFVATLVELVRGGRTLVSLVEVPPVADEDAPSVSVVIAARDEARGVESAMRSVLAQRYPRLEVIAVDDRSNDGTGEILERLAGDDPRLRVVHVRELPAGWLGKNHALWLGAGTATGEVLLFTDADVVMAPTALARGVEFFRQRRLDHLTAAPELRMPGWLLETFGVSFGVFFALFARPWKAPDPRSPHHVGVGAFNLIGAQAYRRIGGHRAIRTRVDDDMKLGKLVKQHGLRQMFANGRWTLSVEWYHSVGELVRGLTKNAFAGVDFRLWVVVVATLGQLACFVWPFVAVWTLSGVARALNLALVLFLLGLYAVSARAQGGNPALAPAFPLAALLFLYVLWRSTTLTLWRRGVDWRGTFYPLAELRGETP